MPHAPCPLPLAPCPLLPAPCSLLLAPCSLLPAPCSMLHAPCSLLLAPCSLLHAPCPMPHAPCSSLLAPRYSLLATRHSPLHPSQPFHSLRFSCSQEFNFDLPPSRIAGMTTWSMLASCIQSLSTTLCRCTLNGIGLASIPIALPANKPALSVHSLSPTGTKCAPTAIPLPPPSLLGFFS